MSKRTCHQKWVFSLTIHDGLSGGIPCLVVSREGTTGMMNTRTFSVVLALLRGRASLHWGGEGGCYCNQKQKTKDETARSFII